MAFFTYITASRRNGTLYTGSTDGLINRATQHRNKSLGASRPDTVLTGSSGSSGTRREKPRSGANGRWNRGWKLRLIEERNPDWIDLAEELRLGRLKDAEDWEPEGE